MQLNSGKLTEYMRRHDEIWPEPVTLLQNAGVADYSILLDEDTNFLFGVLWPTLPHKMATLPEHPVMKRWWAHMVDTMQTHPNNEPVVKPLLSVFQMD